MQITQEDQFLSEHQNNNNNKNFPYLKSTGWKLVNGTDNQPNLFLRAADLMSGVGQVYGQISSRYSLQDDTTHPSSFVPVGHKKNQNMLLMKQGYKRIPD